MGTALRLKSGDRHAGMADKTLLSDSPRPALTMNKKLLLVALVPPLLGATPPGDCDRACLGAVAESYLTAMQAHDPTKVPMAGTVRYTENGVELPLPDGLWRTLESVG